ncbi:MAG: hypothetical protein H6502_03710 [Candidatus Woesearchaeota archaeon]|nr:MAG: hypothetical protein H6502_03710 [Candidatus Woesearchaeota archaeon]
MERTFSFFGLEDRTQEILSYEDRAPSQQSLDAALLVQRDRFLREVDRHLADLPGFHRATFQENYGTLLGIFRQLEENNISLFDDQAADYLAHELSANLSPMRKRLLLPTSPDKQLILNTMGASLQRNLTNPLDRALFAIVSYSLAFETSSYQATIMAELVANAVLSAHCLPLIALDFENRSEAFQHGQAVDAAKPFLKARTFQMRDYANEEAVAAYADYIAGKVVLATYSLQFVPTPQDHVIAYKGDKGVAIAVASQLDARLKHNPAYQGMGVSAKVTGNFIHVLGPEEGTVYESQARDILSGMRGRKRFHFLKSENKKE